MSELPSPSNGYRATLDYPLSLSNMNDILGGMWDALQPYRDIVADADAAINGLNARTLQVIGDSITPELEAVRADVAQAQENVDAYVVDAQAQFDALLAQDFSGLNDPGAARVNMGAAERAWVTRSEALTAKPGDRIKADTSGGAFTVTLSASPADGDEYWFMDPGANWTGNPLAVDGNGQNVLDAPIFPANADGGYFLLVFDGAANSYAVRFFGGAK